MRTTLISILLLTSLRIFCQDAFFYESTQIKSYLNPALTGLDGSLSINIVGKEQFFFKLDDFLSAGISIEQSFPCFRVDLGLYHIFDREGNGMFTTNHSAFNVVYTLPFGNNRYNHNIRFGTKVQYSNKKINWDELYFSDQIDPKYYLTNSASVPNPTSFVPPDWNTTKNITLGFGIIHNLSLFKPDNSLLTWGFALENYTSLFETERYDGILQ